MIAAFALALVLVAPISSTQAPLAPPQMATAAAADPAVDLAAHWRFEAREREVGAPFAATLVVRHSSDEQVEVDEAALDGDASWIQFEAPRLGASHSSDGGSTTEIEWRLASLEPGERELPSPLVWTVARDGARHPVRVAAEPARFVGVLLETEDEPRAPLGFRPIEPLAEGSNARAYLLGAAALALIGAVAWALLRRRARAPVAAPLTASEELAQLDARDLETREGVRETYYQLTSLLRRDVDARARAQRSALTDAEWIAVVSSELPADAVRELDSVLREAESVKYGAHHPTHWAARESLAKARRVLEMLATANTTKELAA